MLCIKTYICLYICLYIDTYFDSRPLESNCPLSKYTISLYFHDIEINRLPLNDRVFLQYGGHLHTWYEGTHRAEC